VNLKSLVHRDLDEGLTEREPASAVGVPAGTNANILVDDPQQNQAIWDHVARHFQIHADVLRSDGPPHAAELFDLTESAHPFPANLPKRRYVWIM